MPEFWMGMQYQYAAQSFHVDLESGRWNVRIFAQFPAGAAQQGTIARSLTITWPLGQCLERIPRPHQDGASSSRLLPISVLRFVDDGFKQSTTANILPDLSTPAIQ